MTAVQGPYSKLDLIKTLFEVDIPQSRQQLRAQIFLYRAIIADGVNTSATKAANQLYKGT